MELRALRYYVEIVEQRSFRGAAARLHVSQPALSRQAQVLERQFGVRLLDRTSRGVEPTAHGWALYHDALALLHVEASVTARPADPGVVVMGYHDAGAVAFLPLLVRRLAEGGIAIHLDLDLRPSDDPAAGIMTGATHVAVTRHPVDDESVVSVAATAEERVFAVPADSDLAEAPFLRVSQLRKTPVLDSPVEPLPAAIRGALAVDGNRRPQSMEACLAAVAAGAVALLPESVAALYPRPGVRFVAAVDSGTSVSRITWRPGYCPPHVSTVVAVAQIVASQMRLPVPPHDDALHDGNPPLAVGGNGASIRQRARELRIESQLARAKASVVRQSAQRPV